MAAFQVITEGISGLISGKFAEICRPKFGRTYDFTAVGKTLCAPAGGTALAGRARRFRSQIMAMVRPDDHRGDLMGVRSRKTGWLMLSRRNLLTDRRITPDVCALIVVNVVDVVHGSSSFPVVIVGGFERLGSRTVISHEIVHMRKQV